MVREIFTRYAAGESYSQIIDALNGAVGKFGRPIGKNSLHSILVNERYTGVYKWNERNVRIMRKWAGGKKNPDPVIIDGIIPPIIDKTTWERVKKEWLYGRMEQIKQKRVFADRIDRVCGMWGDLCRTLQCSPQKRRQHKRKSIL